MEESPDAVLSALSIHLGSNTEVLDCTTLEVDRNSLLASLAFFECVDAADAELVVDANEILVFQEGIDPIKGMMSDTELVELPRLH